MTQIMTCPAQPLCHFTPTAMTDTDTGTTLLDLNLDRTLDSVAAPLQPQWRGRGMSRAGCSRARPRRRGRAAAGGRGRAGALSQRLKPLVQHFIDNVGRAQLVAAMCATPVPQIGCAALQAGGLPARRPAARGLTLEPRADALLHYDVEA